MKKALALALLLAAFQAQAKYGGGNDVILSAEASNGRHGFSLLLIKVKTWVQFW